MQIMVNHLIFLSSTGNKEEFNVVELVTDDSELMKMVHGINPSGLLSATVVMVQSGQGSED